MMRLSTILVAYAAAGCATGVSSPVPAGTSHPSIRAADRQTTDPTATLKRRDEVGPDECPETWTLESSPRTRRDTCAEQVTEEQ